ncbi:hypothetical protein ACELLULO517_12165 [Acidisoma cellulosilytica]|uniref:Uncharacterized protein n=1 Tax=Acidisoma cellulosilyticum TaxID=2802395 RepID=A0A963Z1W4_9PROT|nr:hypothetical protein [Acidisoma cellulosilyticum]MCB8880991.1 hypothetical protein [Acidisoma cellulosilyticum]
MAKAPGGTPKGKTAAPAQFDMNARDRKPGGGGKGRPGGPGRGRDEKRPPVHIITLPATTVDRGTGWVIQKIGKIDQNSKAAMGAEYRLVFDGHDPLSFDYLSAARDRAKEAPPEKPEPAAAPAEEAEAAPAEDETPAAEHPAGDEG